MAQLWVHHKNSSATSLSRLGLEQAVAPGRSFPPQAGGSQRKELSPVPNSSGQSNLRRALSDQSRGGGSTPTGKNGSKTHSMPESVHRLTHYTNRKSSGDSVRKVLPPPPPPPMSQSARKILQLTGFNPAFDQEPKSRYSVSSESSSSSGSHYSEHGSESQDVVPPRGQWATFPADEPCAAYLQSSFYSASEGSASISDMSVAAVAAASAPATSLRVRDRPATQSKKEIDLTGEDSADNLTNEEFMAVEMARYAQQKRKRLNDGLEHNIEGRYGHELTEAADTTDLVPRPLAVRPKSRVDTENDKLDRHYTNPYSPPGFPYDGMPVCTRMPPPPGPASRRKFSTGRNPPSSLFPSSSQKDSEAEVPEQKFRKKFSSAMKLLSEDRKWPAQQRVITNVQRAAGGPDTPLPSNSGFKFFLPSPEILQNAVDKTKKRLRIKTVDEKRREDLKKQVVVVGVNDQSPGTEFQALSNEADDFEMAEYPTGFDGRSLNGLSWSDRSECVWYT